MTQQVQVAKQNNKNTRSARGLLWVAGFVNVALLLMLCAVVSNPAGTAFVIVSTLLINAVVAAYSISSGLPYELFVEYKWKKVCSSLGGNFVGESSKKFVANPGWVFGGSIGEMKSRAIYPKLRQVSKLREGQGFTGVITPLYGQNIDDFIANSSRFAQAYRVSNIQFDRAERGLIAIRAGNVQVPQAYPYQER
jgi:hypothetical protein